MKLTRMDHQDPVESCGCRNWSSTFPTHPAQAGIAQVCLRLHPWASGSHLAMPISIALPGSPVNKDTDMKSDSEAQEKEHDADSGGSDSGSELPELPEGVCGLCEQEFGAQDEDNFGTQPRNIVHCDLDRTFLLEARR